MRARDIRKVIVRISDTSHKHTWLACRVDERYIARSLSRTLLSLHPTSREELIHQLSYTSCTSIPSFLTPTCDFKQPVASFCLLYLTLKSLKSFLPVWNIKDQSDGCPHFPFLNQSNSKARGPYILWHYHHVIRGCNQHSYISSFNSPSYFNFVYLNVMFFSIEAIYEYFIVRTKVNILRLWGFLVADRHLHSIQHHNSADFCLCFYKCSSLNVFLNYFLTTCLVLCFCNSFFNSALSLFAVIFACKTALQRPKSHSLCKKRALWLYSLHH